MNNVKNVNMFKKAQPNLGEPPTDRTSKQETFNTSPSITIQFPYNIQVQTPLNHHHTCHNLLKKVAYLYRQMKYSRLKPKTSASLTKEKSSHLKAPIKLIL